MRLIRNYGEDVIELISSEDQYILPNNFGDAEWELPNVIKLSVFNVVGSFLNSHELRKQSDYYIREGKVYLRPNELLDREEYSSGDYTLQFDFIERYEPFTLVAPFTPNNELYDGYNELHLAEISPTRTEIRLNSNLLEPKVVDENTLTVGEQISNQTSEITNFLNYNKGEYEFDSFIEIPGFDNLIPINAYAFDTVSTENKTISLILKLNQPFLGQIPLYSKSIRLVRKFLQTQRQTITFVDTDGLATGAADGLPVDVGYVVQNSTIDDSDKNYNDLSSGSLNIISDLTQKKKDKNLNIDFSEFDNHVFFGSAVSKLEKFKLKVEKIDHLQMQLSASLGVTGSKHEIKNRNDIFKKIRQEKETFTAYEKFMYNDNQETSKNSAPGLGTNLAGSNFDNNYNDYTVLSNVEGFDRLYKKEATSDRIHLFTDIFNVDQPPFYNTNDFVYLSFILRSKSAEGSTGLDLEINGGEANESFQNTLYKNYDYGRTRKIPFNTFSGSAISNNDDGDGVRELSVGTSQETTGSHYFRYIFRAQQNYFRPLKAGSNYSTPPADRPIAPPLGRDEIDLNDLNDYSSTSTQFEILSGSNYISASTSASFAQGFAFGIKDTSGQQTQYIFPTVVDRNNLTNTFTFVTGSILPQGDLFPIYIDSTTSEVNFTDVYVSYKDPTNTLPFSKLYRPPSGSYAGSTEWNNWYTEMYNSASTYDNDNIHSMINNLPLSLRTESKHEVLRSFVNMLGEEFDLLRNYIDNYLNFYKLGYKNPSSMPDNLMPILGDTVGWELLNRQNKNTSIEDYAENTAGDEVGVQAVINSTWKKILNNLMYVYKTKGTTESISSLLNLYGFDSTGFKMSEYGGSTAEHNPSIITNDSQDFTEGITNVQGNVTYHESIEPFPMINFRGTNSLGVDWWRNDASANGIEFVFNSEKTTNEQTILRSSGSSNDLWDLRLVPSASSTDFSQVQFRLNTSNSASLDITGSAVSMSSPFVDFQNGSIYNVFLQRSIVTGSSPHNAFTQSYELFIAKKDDDKILNVSATSMSCAISGANYNFVNQNVSKISNNLFVGESLTGSLAEIRVWDSFVSMSKFKQHTLNYRSTVANSITGSVASLTYRYPFDENIIDWSTNPNSASLKVHDANPQNVKDFSILIASQDNFNYTTTMTEQIFYRLVVQGTDVLPNDNQTNLNPTMTIEGELNSETNTLTDPTDSSGELERQYSNVFGRNVSYVNAIDTLIMNQMPDFRIDDFIGDPDEDLTDTYEDLMKLRKSLIIDPDVKVDVVANIKAVEDVLTDEVKETIELLTPAKTNFEMFYDIKNDTLFRSKIGRKMKMTPQLNPNKATGIIDADKWDEPSLTSFANNNLKIGTVDADQWDEPTVTSFANNNLKIGNIDADKWDEPTLSSFVNQNKKIGNIDAEQWDQPSLGLTLENISSPATNIEIIDTSNSINESVYNVSPDKMNEFFLGPKNNIAENAGTSSNQRFFKSINPGVHGDYNTYKFESRFTFKTIGDTERFHNSQSHHDVFSSFRNRHFVDKNHAKSYVYNSFFGSNGEGTVNGRMVGRTRFYKTDSNGAITYPSNHYINARTSKDQLLNLIYKGTQHDGSNPTQDPIKNDPTPSVAAYVISVAGSDTLNKIKVDRPISKNVITILVGTKGAAESLNFKLFQKNKLISSNVLSPQETGGNPSTAKIKFNLVGDIKNYSFRATPATLNNTILASNVRVTKIKEGGQFVQKASISLSRFERGVEGRFNKITGDFTLTIRLT